MPKLLELVWTGHMGLGRHALDMLAGQPDPGVDLSWLTALRCYSAVLWQGLPPCWNLATFDVNVSAGE